MKLGRGSWSWNDEAPIRLLVRVNLAEEGIETLEAQDGIARLDLARAESPDLIVLDVMMPRMHGWEAAERLRADPATRDIPIVFLTPHKGGWHRRAFELGAVDYITCPFNPLKLPATIRELLERIERGEREELRLQRLAAWEAMSEAATTPR